MNPPLVYSTVHFQKLVSVHAYAFPWRMLNMLVAYGGTKRWDLPDDSEIVDFRGRFPEPDSVYDILDQVDVDTNIIRTRDGVDKYADSLPGAPFVIWGRMYLFSGYAGHLTADAIRLFAIDTDSTNAPEMWKSFLDIIDLPPKKKLLETYGDAIKDESVVSEETLRAAGWRYTGRDLVWTHSWAVRKAYFQNTGLHPSNMQRSLYDDDQHPAWLISEILALEPPRDPKVYYSSSDVWVFFAHTVPSLYDAPADVDTSQLDIPSRKDDQDRFSQTGLPTTRRAMITVFPIDVPAYTLFSNMPPPGILTHAVLFADPQLALKFSMDRYIDNNKIPAFDLKPKFNPWSKGPGERYERLARVAYMQLSDAILEIGGTFRDMPRIPGTYKDISIEWILSLYYTAAQIGDRDYETHARMQVCLALAHKLYFYTHLAEFKVLPKIFTVQIVPWVVLRTALDRDTDELPTVLANGHVSKFCPFSDPELDQLMPAWQAIRADDAYFLPPYPSFLLPEGAIQVYCKDVQAFFPGEPSQWFTDVWEYYAWRRLSIPIETQNQLYNQAKKAYDMINVIHKKNEPTPEWQEIPMFFSDDENSDEESQEQEPPLPFTPVPLWTTPEFQLFMSQTITLVGDRMSMLMLEEDFGAPLDRDFPASAVAISNAIEDEMRISQY